VAPQELKFAHFTRNKTHTPPTRAGFYPGFKPATLPAVPGLEGVGKVARCGAATSGKWREGQRVVGVPWGTLGGHGTWAQYTVAPEAALFAVPDAVPDDAAAQFLVNPLTALAFFDVLDVPRGGWLLSNAANSVLGRMLIRLAARRGVRTVNLVRRREYVAALEALGADAVVVTTEGDDVAQRVREITGELHAHTQY
jgi:NADPH:quinone reductase-like Zn-dependent oxidoreductase